MRGTLFLVVGPSGAGKDTLIGAARAARPDLAVPRRVVTRGKEAGGEEIEAVDEAEFSRRLAAGEFALAWRAHGLGYAIPARIEAELAAGRCGLANVSRGVIGEARARLAPVRVIVVTAPEAVLAARLAARGREDAGDVAARLARAGAETPAGPDVTVVRNDGALEPARAAFLAALQPASA